MIPIPLFGGQTALTLIAAVVPAVVAWWNDRRLLGSADDPALPELLANRRRLSVRSIAIAVAVMIVLGGRDAAWGIPLLIVLLIAVGYPIRTRLLGETWGFGAYLWHTAASIVGGFGFWIALCYAPTIVRRIVESAGAERWWVAVALAAVIAAGLFAWETWYPRLWLWAHAGERLESPALTPRFDDIVKRAGTIAPQVYRVGPKGSRFVNAVALPSVRRPSVAMGNALLDLLEPEETAAIFAHEVAHFDHFTPRHVRRVQLLNRALIVIGVTLPLLATLAYMRWAQWIGWVWPVIVLFALGRRAAKSQQHETESDLRAAALCGDPEALVRGLVKLHLHARIPRRYAVDIERAASHPSLVRRIQAIRAGAAEAVEQLGAATVVRSTRAGSWVVLEDARSYWLDGVPEGTDAQLAALREASSSYRAVNYKDLVELRVSAAGDARTIAARTRGGDHWSVPIAPDDVVRVQRALDIVDLRMGKAGPAPSALTPKIIALAAFAVALLAGQAGVVLGPILVAMSKSSASALAALGAMSIVRAVLGALEGSSWFDADIVRIGLVAMAVIGVAAMYTAARLVRAGEATTNLRLTMAVLIGVAVLMATGVVMQTIRMPAMPIIGSAMLSGFGTALFGIAAALFVVQSRWARPAAFTTLVLAATVVTLGVDRKAFTLRHALAEGSARATLSGTTELTSLARDLHVSPNGTHFLVMRTAVGARQDVNQRVALIAGRVGGDLHDIRAVAGEFVDDARILVVDELDPGVELRIEGVDRSGPLWADTLADVSLRESRVLIDREAGTWTIVGTEADSDGVAVFSGKIGEKGGARRALLPDTIPMTTEPVVFDQGATLVVPSYRSAQRARMAPISLWSLPFFGFDMPTMELWLVHGDSVRPLAPMRGAVQCGEPLGGVAACSVQRMNATSLYTLSATGEAVEVARVASNELRVMRPGPGPRVASTTFDRGIVLVDLPSRRLTRVAVPPNGAYASEVRSGDGWIVALDFGQNRRSTIRSYRLNSK